jgi:hypothetical protein
MKQLFIVRGEELCLTEPFSHKLTNRQRLELSIKKWGTIAAYHALVPEARTLVSAGTPTCALCDKYWDKPDCKGCPVFNKTRKKYCVNTPMDTYLSNNYGVGAIAETATRAASFLRSLRSNKKVHR